MLVRALVGSAVFFLLGPFIASLEIAWPLSFVDRLTGLPDYLALLAFSYIFGLLHAVLTGAAAGALMTCCSRSWTFIALCVLADFAASGVVWPGIGPMMMGVIGVLPTIICAMVLWRIRGRLRGTSITT